MSAWIVPKTHIDALVTAGLTLPQFKPFSWYFGETRRELRQENASEVGRMLWRENVKSVAARYGSDEDLPGPVPQPDPEAYSYRGLAGFPESILILKAISCFEYQSCEHEGWSASEAAAFCEALRGAAISRLPGWDDEGGWPIDSPAAFAWRKVSA